MRLLTSVNVLEETTNKKKQAGAELCQAQFKLRLAKQDLTNFIKPVFTW